MAGQKKAMKRVAIVQAVNPRQCPSHGEPTDTGSPTFCTNCDQPVRGTDHACWKQGDEIHEPDPELLRGAPAPTTSLPKSLRCWLVEIPGREPFRSWARSRPMLRKYLKRAFHLETLPPGTRIVELTQ